MEEALDLSFDRLLMMMMMIYTYIFIYIYIFYIYISHHTAVRTMTSGFFTVYETCSRYLLDRA